MTSIREVVVTIAIETNKQSHDVTVTQQDDESDEDFTTRVGLAITGLKEAALA
jgi:hypothetical protein